MRIDHLLGLANTPTRTPCPPGNVCRDLRKYLQIRLTDIAAAVGTTESTMRRYEQGSMPTFADRQVTERVASLMEGLGYIKDDSWMEAASQDRSGRYLA